MKLKTLHTGCSLNGLLYSILIPVTYCRPERLLGLFDDATNEEDVLRDFGIPPRKDNHYDAGYSMMEAMNEQYRKKRAAPNDKVEEEVCKSENFCKNRMLRVPNGYNFFEIPFQPKIGNKTPPINVTMKARVERIRHINEIGKEITLDMEITLGWTDWKILAFRKNFTQEDLLDYINKGLHLVKPSRMLTLNNPQYLQTIWKPNLFIYDLIDKSQPKLMSDLITLQYDPDGGFIFYLTRVLLKLSCHMEFKYYPTDTYKFTFQIRGFSYNENLLNLMWYNPPYLANRDQSNFEVQLNEYAAGKINLGDETFNILNFSLLLRRKLSYHVVQTYVPSYIFLMITWLCFLIPTKMVEVRVGICMTTLLTLTAMQSRDTSPQSAYVKALDIWMVTCCISVFFTLLQFALLTWFVQMVDKCEEQIKYLRERDATNTANIRKIAVKSSAWEKTWDTIELQLRAEYFTNHPSAVRAEKSLRDLTSRLKCLKRNIYILERYAFVVFFGLFAIFNAVYWSWLIIMSGFLKWPDINTTLNVPDKLDID